MLRLMVNSRRCRDSPMQSTASINTQSVGIEPDDSASPTAKPWIGRCVVVMLVLSHASWIGGAAMFLARFDLVLHLAALYRRACRASEL